MIVSGGKILALDHVNSEFPLTGDGSRVPLGLDSAFVESIREVSGKLDTSAFEDWSAQTAGWDVTEYSAGPNIDITDHTVSGRDWTPELREKVDSSAFAEAPFGYAMDFLGEGSELNIAENSEILWVSLSGQKFGAERSVSDRLGNIIDETYVTSGDLSQDKQYCMTSSGWREVTVRPYLPGEGIAITDYTISVSGDYQHTSGMSAYYEKSEVDQKIEDVYDSLPTVVGGWGISVTSATSAYPYFYEVGFSGSSGTNGVSGDGTRENPYGLENELYELSAVAPLSIRTEGSIDIIEIDSAAIDTWSSVSADYYKKSETSGASQISTAFEHTSAWAEDTFERKLVPSEDEVLLVGSADGSKSWKKLETSGFGEYLTDEDGVQLLDENSEPIVAENFSELWYKFDEKSFGSERSVSDRLGNIIDECYATKSALDGVTDGLEDALDTLNDALESVAHAGMYDLGTKTESDLNNGKLAIGCGNSNTELTLTTVNALTVLANSGVPNFALLVNNSGNSNDVTVTVKDSTDTTTFYQSTAAGNTIGAGKIYQITCVGKCWTMAEFELPGA